LEGGQKLALPKWHAIPTVVIGVTSVVAYPLSTPRNSLILIAVIGLGVFVDGDHLSIRRIKRILRGEKGPVPGWINYMHTWGALMGLVVLSFLIGNWLPFLSYTVHMLMDGANRDNVEESVSPLPKSLHRFYPEWCKYEIGNVI
jgi:hypothetical protein